MSSTSKLVLTRYPAIEPQREPSYFNRIIRVGELRLGTWVVVATGLMATGYVTTAQAQTSEAFAESLYQDGKRYLQAEDYGHACPKLAQSYKIDPAGGTALLLAICYEQQGKLASAWARYNDALALAKRDAREDRQRRAQEGLETVEPKLSYIRLTLDPSGSGMAGLTLSIDGTELPAISDTRLPIDPGLHQLIIKAPNHEDWKTEIDVGGPAEVKDVWVPALRSETRVSTIPSSPTRAASPLPVTENSAKTTEGVSHAEARRSAYVIGGAGIAAVGVGAYFGIRAIKLNHDANQWCPTNQCRDGQLGAISKIDQARSSAHAADILIGVGSAAVASAALLWYIYRKDTPAVTAGADVAMRSVSINWQQSF
jgi:hypothetical protein